jgi:hypothetical protein
MHVVASPPSNKKHDPLQSSSPAFPAKPLQDFARKERETLAPIIEKANIKPN